MTDKNNTQYPKFLAWMSKPAPDFAAKVEQTASSNQILIDALWAAWQAGYQEGQMGINEQR